MTDNPEVPGNASGALAGISDALDKSLEQERSAVAAGSPQTTVQVGQKLTALGKESVRQGYFANLEGFFAAFAATLGACSRVTRNVLQRSSTRGLWAEKRYAATLISQGGQQTNGCCPSPVCSDHTSKD